MPVKRPAPRLPVLEENQLSEAQRALLGSLRAEPARTVADHARTFRGLDARAGIRRAWRRRWARIAATSTGLEPRLSEFAILCTARAWRAQYEWFAHAPIAERAGVKPKTIADLRAGRTPKSAPKDERAIYAFVQELYKNKRVSDRSYKRLHGFIGDAGLVELTGILGYYAMVAMTLNVFRMMPPPDAALGFAEPKV